MTLSICSNPSIFLKGSGIALALKKCLFKIGYKVPVIRLDLPEPETPDTTMSFPNGKETDRFFKLCPVAPCNDNVFPLPSRRFSGILTSFVPLR
ncbi:hypothetical protein D3C73_1016210 [compost metagenome]